MGCSGDKRSGFCAAVGVKGPTSVPLGGGRTAAKLAAVTHRRGCQPQRLLCSRESQAPRWAVYGGAVGGDPSGLTTTGVHSLNTARACKTHAVATGSAPRLRTVHIGRSPHALRTSARCSHGMGHGAGTQRRDIRRGGTWTRLPFSPRYKRGVASKLAHRRECRGPSPWLTALRHKRSTRAHSDPLDGSQKRSKMLNIACSSENPNAVVRPLGLRACGIRRS